MFWNEKLFSFPNLSACPTDATSDGTSDCKCTATGATTDGTADCKCAKNFQFNADKSACVGKFHRNSKDNTPKGGCTVGWVQDSCQAPKLIPGHSLA